MVCWQVRTLAVTRSCVTVFTWYLLHKVITKNINDFFYRCVQTSMSVKRVGLVPLVQPVMTPKDPICARVSRNFLLGAMENAPGLLPLFLQLVLLVRWKHYLHVGSSTLSFSIPGIFGVFVVLCWVWLFCWRIFCAVQMYLKRQCHSREAYWYARPQPRLLI